MLLLLQEIIQGMLSKHDLLDKFNDHEIKKVEFEFINGQESMLVERSNHIISLTLKKPYYLFEFKVYETSKWGEVACSVGESYYPVLIKDGGIPAFSGKGYARFKEYAAELSHKLEIEDWLNKASLVDKDPGPSDPKAALPAEKFSRFQTNIHKILAKHELLDAFYNPSVESVYLKLHQESYMDLVIERQYRTVFVGHYREQNGDLISDPVLVFEVREEMCSRGWDPFRIEQVFGDTQIMGEQDGKKGFYPKRLKAFKSFANMFAGNIKDQGWNNADVVDKRCVLTDANQEELEERKLESFDAQDIIADSEGQMAFGF